MFKLIKSPNQCIKTWKLQKIEIVLQVKRKRNNEWSLINKSKSSILKKTNWKSKIHEFQKLIEKKVYKSKMLQLYLHLHLNNRFDKDQVAQKFNLWKKKLRSTSIKKRMSQMVSKCLKHKIRSRMKKIQNKLNWFDLRHQSRTKRS